MYHWSQSFRPQAQTPGVPHVRPSHLPLFSKYRDGKGKERRFITTPQEAVERGKVSTEPIFINLQVIDMSFRFKWRKNWSRGKKICTIKQCWSKCGLIGYSLSSVSPRVLEKLLLFVITWGEQVIKWLLLLQGTISTLEVIVFIWWGRSVLQGSDVP
jgi:hypothetical protein